MSKGYMVVIDIDKIQSYIFATPKLKEIRGASAVLADFNDFDEVSERVGNAKGKLIYAGGGTVKAYFDNDDYAKEFILKETKKCREVTKTATLSCIIEETTTEEFEKDFVSLNERAERKLRKHKESKYFNNQLLNNPFIKFCDSCRTYPATKRYDSEESILCHTCLEKRFRSSRSRLFDNFRKWLGKELELKNDSLPGWGLSKLNKYNNDEILKDKDISDIGDKSNNYIGLICCDGNRMGQKLKEIVKIPDDYTEFSKLVKDAVENILFKVVAEEIAPDDKDYVPVEFILMGGDDLVIIVPANKAVMIARKFCKGFHKETSSGGKEVSMSAGVAIAHSKFPISRLHNVAEGLLKSAKRLSNNLKSEHIEASCLDFAIISSPSSSPINEIRGKEYTCGNDDNYKLFRRPYPVYDSKTENDELDDLTDTIKELKSISFPRTKLNQFYQILFTKEKEQIVYDALLLRARLNKKQREVFDKQIKDKFTLTNFPWWKTVENGKEIYKTPISDIVELYDFID